MLQGSIVGGGGTLVRNVQGATAVAVRETLSVARTLPLLLLLLLLLLPSPLLLLLLLLLLQGCPLRTGCVATCPTRSPSRTRTSAGAT